MEQWVLPDCPVQSVDAPRSGKTANPQMVERPTPDSKVSRRSSVKMP